MAAQGTSDIGLIAQAVDSIFRFYGRIADFFVYAPRRIAKQREASRPDSIQPGQFDFEENSGTLIIVAIVGFLLIIGFIVFQATKK